MVRSENLSLLKSNAHPIADQMRDCFSGETLVCETLQHQHESVSGQTNLLFVQYYQITVILPPWPGGDPTNLHLPLAGGSLLTKHTVHEDCAAGTVALHVPATFQMIP